MGPTIATVPEGWDRIIERDKRDPRYNFDELVPSYRSLAGTGHGVTFGYWK